MRTVDWFSGIGGFRLALDRQGFETTASCELARFPRSVYAERFGEPPTYEDMTHVDPHQLEKHAFLWTGGFPCQDVSAAGQGLGLLGGKRSGLVFRLLSYAAVARPQWILLENTPGLLFRGRGYGRLLGILARLGYGFCWRRVDAQYFGVAQRRKRIFLLACFGARAGMRRAAEILLEPEGVRRDPPPRREAGARVASTLTRSLGRRGSPRGQPDGENLVVAKPLLAGSPRSGGRRGNPDETFVVSAPVTSKWAKGTGGPAGDECQNLVPAFGQGVVPAWIESVADPVVTREQRTYTHEGSENFRTRITHPENRSACTPGSPAGSLAASGVPESVACPHGRFVRRLTPKECERLQGFPDDWTLIEGASDAARYRALGNAVAVPCVEWILKRLRELA